MVYFVVTIDLFRIKLIHMPPKSLVNSSLSQNSLHQCERLPPGRKLANKIPQSSLEVSLYRSNQKVSIIQPKATFEGMEGDDSDGSKHDS